MDIKLIKLSFGKLYHQPTPNGEQWELITATGIIRGNAKSFCKNIHNSDLAEEHKDEIYRAINQYYIGAEKEEM